MLNIALTIISKGVMLPAIGMEYDRGYDLSKNPYMLVGLWLAICYLPAATIDTCTYVSFKKVICQQK